MLDYAGAWTSLRGRCFRLVYTDEDGRPTDCPESPVRVGWKGDGQGRWYPVDACERHAVQLERRPHPAPVKRAFV